ncbi:hypothetical protein SANTM175S_10033 [Streptomyces antimycoticus]
MAVVVRPAPTARLMIARWQLSVRGRRTCSSGCPTSASGALPPRWNRDRRARVNEGPDGFGGGSGAVAGAGPGAAGDSGSASSGVSAAG